MLRQSQQCVNSKSIALSLKECIYSRGWRLGPPKEWMNLSCTSDFKFTTLSFPSFIIFMCVEVYSTKGHHTVARRMPMKTCGVSLDSTSLTATVLVAYPCVPHVI